LQSMKRQEVKKTVVGLSQAPKVTRSKKTEKDEPPRVTTKMQMKREIHEGHHKKMLSGSRHSKVKKKRHRISHNLQNEEKEKHGWQNGKVRKGRGHPKKRGKGQTKERSKKSSAAPNEITGRKDRRNKPYAN